MRIGMVGLGRMGANMATRLIEGGHEVVAFDVNPDAVDKAADGGATASSSLEELVAELAAPRTVWVMVPAGTVTGETIDALARAMSPGDAIIDGGNSRYIDTIARASALEQDSIALVDAGTSGGIWGLHEGYCLMVGGEESTVHRLGSIFETLAPPDGYTHVGPAGSGHFVKMVHNGVEYALMQAYAEGFEILRHAPWPLDLAAIAEVWRHGSVVRSWLLDLTASALHKDPELERLSDYVEDSGEGRWTVQTAIDAAVPAPSIALSLFARFASRQDESFAGKLLAALRNEFGGHMVRPPGG